MRLENTYTRLLRAGARTALTVLGLACFFATSASANEGEERCEPCFSVPYFTVNYGIAPQIESDGHSALVAVGEVARTARTAKDSYSAVPGFFSYYLTQPLPPLVIATHGDFQDKVEIRWDVFDDIVGPPVTGSDLLIYRNGTELISLPSNRKEYQDFNVFPGEEYEYSVEVTNSLGASHPSAEIGFLNPNGAIIGTVETPNGNPVSDVKVVLTPNLGRSAEFEGEDYVFFPPDSLMFRGLEQSYTIEGWFRSRAMQQQTLFAATDSANTRVFARIDLTDTGQLLWQHRGGTEGRVDITTADSYTDDGEWHHFAAVLADSNMSMTLYVDGRIAARGTAADTIGTQRTQVVIGKKGAIQHEQYFQGFLDDWRVWSAPRTRAEIRRDMDRTLEGDEGDLAAYWKFDEVKGETLFDLTANDQDGIVCKIERSDFNAPVFVSGITDTLGRYAIRGIYYGAGTTFTATPQKETPIGTSLEFDGVDDYLEFAQDRLDFRGGYTLETWFKNPGTTGNMTLFSATDPADGSNQARIDLLEDGTLRWSHLGVDLVSATSYNDEFWYYVSASFDTTDGALTLYVNGEEIGSGAGDDIDALSEFVMARRQSALSPQHFRGWLDEVRVWDRGRRAQDIGAVMNQYLKGDNVGLIAYWHFNEGDDVLALDATENSHIGTLMGVPPWRDDVTKVPIGSSPWSGDIPLNEVFSNTFDPESRQVILSPQITSVDQVDFTDISQIAVSGFVKYSDTVCFIEGAEVLVNGESLVPPIRTDANGRFVAEFEPGARQQRISIKYKDHDFLPAPFIELPTIIKPITGLFFEDTVKRNVSGQVAGGACLLPIAPTQGQIEVELTAVNGCCNYTVVPDLTTGSYSINDVPPIIYNVTVNHPNPEIDAFFTADTLSAEVEDRLVDFVYRAPPEVAISGFPTNNCGLRVMEMAGEYDLDISIFETYFSQGLAQSCAIDSGSVVIFDGIGDAGEVELEFQNGQAQYRAIGRFPNIVGGGDHPYQKNIQVTAIDSLERNATVEEWTYVTGNRPREINFATTSPQLPFLILREPPGDGSFSYIKKGEKLSSSISLGTKKTDSTSGFATLHLGPDIQFSTGMFFSVNTKVDVTADFTAEFGVTNSQSTTQEQTWSFTATDGFATAGEGDVYVGGALNILYGITDVLAVDDNTCEASVTPDIIVIPDGFATTFIHSENFITDNVIPELELLGETQSADLWRSFVSYNDGLKQLASFSRNITFDAGTVFDYTETSQLTESEAIQFEMEIDAGLAAVVGVTVNGVGAKGGVRTNWEWKQGKSEKTSTTQTNTVGFKLADNDAGDNFSVNVKNGPVYGTPVFDLISGVSSCPWEFGTVPVDGPQLTVSPAQQVDVDPDAPAVFGLTLGNISQTEADRTYDLRVVNESNSDGAAIAFNGVFVEDGLSFDVPFGEAVQAVMSVFRGPEEYTYDDLVVELISPCDSKMVDEASVSAHFTVPCSEVAVALPEDGWVFTSADTSGGQQISVTLNGYDRLDENLERLELQYRPASGGDWFVAEAVPKVDLTEDFKLITWNISPSIVLDNDYQLRARAVCGIGRVPGTSPTISGTIDRTGPQPLGAPQPGDGILHADDEIAVVFNEDINCGEISIGAGDVTLTNSVTSEGIDFDFTCGGNQLIIDPNIQNTFMENLTLRASVGPVEDLLGNESSEPVVWEFFVNRNPIEWAGLDLNNISIFEDEAFTTTRLLVNNGGSPRSFTFTNVDVASQPLVGPRPISIPSWLDVEPREGTIQPGSSLEVTFSIDGNEVGAGAFNTTLYASGGQGEEPRLLDFRVLCYPPDWGRVDPTDYDGLMSITATLETDGELSEDAYDQVGVFIDGELRGLAHVEYVPAFAQLANTPSHELFLTVYGNQSDAGKKLDLRVWDASACRELGLVLEEFNFANNDRLGTPTSPTAITATSQIIGKIPFSDGWNWFSLNLQASDMSTNSILSSIGAADFDHVRSKVGFSTYSSALGWIGSLQIFDNQSMYQIHLAQPDTLEMIGYAVDVELTSVPVFSGWNEIAYLPQVSLEVNSALESLPAQTGDIIRGQFQFAQFVEGLGWIGSLRFLNPHQAYKLNVQQAGALEYPFFEGAGAGKVVAPHNAVAAMGWKLDPRLYRNSMMITAVVEGEERLDSEDDAVAVFVGDEIRGIGETVYVPSLGQHVAFVTVYSDVSEGEVVEFRFFDGESERFVPTDAEFVANAAVGSIAEPYVLETRARRLGDRGFVPDEFVLSQSYPNPFNPSTKIGYGLPEDGAVELAIYNVVGQRIRVLKQDFERAGYYYAVWDGRDDNGYVVPTGVYFSVMQAPGFRATRKLMLLK